MTTPSKQSQPTSSLPRYVRQHLRSNPDHPPSKLVRGGPPSNTSPNSRLPVSTSNRQIRAASPTIQEETMPAQTVSTSVSRFGGRKNSLFEIVDPHAFAGQSQSQALDTLPDGTIHSNQTSLVERQDDLSGRSTIGNPVAANPGRPARPPSLRMDSDNAEISQSFPAPPSLTYPEQANNAGSIAQPVTADNDGRSLTSTKEAGNSLAATHANQSNSVDEERALRSDLLSRLEQTFGKQILNDVDREAIVSMRADRGKMSAAPSPEIPSQPVVPVAAPTTGMTRSSSTQSSEGKRKKGFFGFGGKKNRRTSETPTPVAAAPARTTNGIFGRPLAELPKLATCVTRIGENQEHVLPIIIFATVEEMYRSGLKSPSLFRRFGDASRIDYLTDVFNKPPNYGDGVHLHEEALDTTAGLFKRFLRDMPEPVFDQRLFQLYVNSVLHPAASTQAAVGAAQTILRLLPRPNFSLFVYLIAFLGQLAPPTADPAHTSPHNGHDELSALLGPALMAPRKPASSQQETVGKTGADSTFHMQDNIAPQPKKDAQNALRWTLDNWSAVCGPPVDLAACKVPQRSSLVPVEASATFSDPEDATSASEDENKTSLSSLKTSKRYSDVDPALKAASPLATWRDTFDPGRQAVLQKHRRLGSSQGSLERAEPAAPALATPGDLTAGMPGALPLAVSAEPPLNPSLAVKSDDKLPFPMTMLISSAEPELVGGSFPRGRSDKTLNANFASAPDNSAKPRVNRQPSTDGSPSARVPPPQVGLERAPSNSTPERRKTPRKIASLVEELQKRYDESEESNEHLRADHDVLLRRIAEQEGRNRSDREGHQSRVDELLRDISLLKGKLAEAQRNRAAEDEELTRHWKGIAAAAQSEAQASREQTSSELERLIKIVKDVTRERDVANRKLRHIRKALSLGSTTSLQGDTDETLSNRGSN